MSSIKILQPIKAGKFISEISKNVFIDLSGITETSNKIYDRIKLNSDELSVKRWKLHELLPQANDLNAIEWVFISDVLNFSFWTPNEKKFKIVFNGKEWTGFWALCAAMGRAIKEGIHFVDASYYSKISLDELRYVMRSDDGVEMPMLHERLDNLHQAGNVILKKYNGKFLNMIISCDKSAQKLLQMIIEDFPSFRDTAEIEGQIVGIYKRAQILVADVWACMQGEGICNFMDINTITTFADYRIPQVLVWLGVLKYSDHLMELLKNDHLFCSGDRLEVEIRGCTIWAIELIVEELKRLMKADSFVPSNEINSVIVDHYLWDFRREHDADTQSIPFHKIRCIYY